jgi:predicted porin
MQKKIIALAVAGLVSGAAFAQSNVTVYGVADMYYAYSSANTANQDRSHHINSGGLSGSRIGFKGTEDLGNGLKALFVLEYGLTADNKTTGVGSGAAARQQLVGLTGNFGTVVAGSAQTTGYDFSCAASPVAGSALDTYHAIGARNLVSCGHDGRASNAVAYISPSFSGLTFAYNHARVTEGANRATAAATNPTGDASANLMSASYANGPITAGLVWSKISMNNTSGGDDVTEWGVRGSYDFGVAKLFGSYQNMDTGVAAGSDQDDSKWQVSVAVPVGAAGTVALQYADNNMDANNADSKGWTLAYLHAMSKRTTAYAGYSRISNDNGASKNFGLGTPMAGDNATVLAVGLRHTF